MATHNCADVIGYLTENPKRIPEKSLVLFTIRTTRRILNEYPNTNHFEDLLIYCDDINLYKDLGSLRMYDLIRVKGVINVLTIDKRLTPCPYCQHTGNVKSNSSSVIIYPIFFEKKNSLKTTVDENIFLPDKIINDRYQEVSNLMTFIGTVVSEPELIERNTCCRYQIGMDRKYYIKTQPELTADYPWIYSYGKQAGKDYKHLVKGSTVLISGFMHNELIEPTTVCNNCGRTYKYQDTRNETIPYSVEYLNQYLTDKDIAEALQNQEQ